MRYNFAACTRRYPTGNAPGHIQLKSVERIPPAYEAQTLTYLRLSGCMVGLLMNFNSVILKGGLRCFIP